ncbi:MAG: methylated-DNA--[protein]-cysteine S-methyltransferase [Olegusella sp.]|nr:methylated-DNA--[protein]-cysteine S-methyltransferase [Olegusella sp.]
MSADKKSRALTTVVLDTPLEEVLVAACDEGVCGLWYHDQVHFGGTCQTELPQATRVAAEELDAAAETSPAAAHLARVRDWLDRYFVGDRPAPDELTFCLRGTPFQEAVWAELRHIPFGQMTTYGELGKRAAVRLGKERTSARATGGAVGRNPVNIIIPCHRVVGASGYLTGYDGGLPRKVWLLEHEGVPLEVLKLVRR